MQILSQKDITVFRDTLSRWHANVIRPMPWKETKDPYKIWLSEVILQQTRVEQGWNYYLDFIKTYPTVLDLANAHEDEVLRLWQGLGYYSRARNLHYSAKYIVENFDGVFPRAYSDILSLKGVGKYTAAAISSFAYNESYAVVDGNVIRVLSRYYGIYDPIDVTATQKMINALATELLDIDDAANHNQAMIDFGAIHCKPKNPLCDGCPYEESCIAYADNRVGEVPYKSKKVKKKNRFLYYFLKRNTLGQYAIIRRESNDIWKGLYEFPNIESDHELTDHQLGTNIQTLFQHRTAYRIELQNDFPIKHVLSHLIIFAKFYTIESSMPFSDREYLYADLEELNEKYAFPVLISNFIDSIF